LGCVKCDRRSREPSRRRCAADGLVWQLVRIVSPRWRGDCAARLTRCVSSPRLDRLRSIRAPRMARRRSSYSRLSGWRRRARATAQWRCVSLDLVLVGGHGSIHDACGVAARPLCVGSEGGGAFVATVQRATRWGRGGGRGSGDACTQPRVGVQERSRASAASPRAPAARESAGEHLVERPRLERVRTWSDSRMAARWGRGGGGGGGDRSTRSARRVAGWLASALNPYARPARCVLAGLARGRTLAASPTEWMSSRAKRTRSNARATTFGLAQC
jgi:hypothetical protein